MKITKEFKIGLLTVVASAMLYFGFTYLKGVDLSPSNNTYYMVVGDAEGLAPSSQVMVNGKQVGRVLEIALMPENDNKLKITLSIAKEVEMGDSTIAMLASVSLMGDKGIKLLIKGGEKIKPNATINAISEKSLLDKFGSSVEPLRVKLDTTLSSVNALIDAQNRLAIAQTLRNLSQMSATLNNEMNHIGPNLSKASADIDKLTSSLIETEKQLKPLLAKLNSFSDSLNKAPIARTIENANTTIAELQALSKNLNEGKGTLGKLMKDEALYSNMNKTVKDLDSLFLDVKARPSRYVHVSVFGKKEKKEKK